MTYQQAIDYLYNSLPVFHKIGSKAYKPGLENTTKLMDELAHPYKKYKTIHIAGTNGKGSVSHLLAAILQNAGYKTGLYTSPHLLDFGERIKIDGKMIERRYIIDFVETYKNKLDKIQPSFFETTMAMAFEYFADNDIDIAIVEAGLGGRLDSTNIIKPILSIITNISFDHTSFLGNTLAEIAAEKAGIIKENTPVLIGEYLPETKNVFTQKAKEKNAPIKFVEDELQVNFCAYEKDKMLIKTSENEEYKLGLVGNYQLKNTATVLVAAKELIKNGLRLSAQNIKTGLENVIEITDLQGRWQKLSEKPLIITDTGHNLAAMHYISAQLNKQSAENLRIVIGFANDKDLAGMLKILPSEAIYYFTQADVSRAFQAEDLWKEALPLGLKGSFYPSVALAIEQVLKDASPDDFVFIGGSNFVVGEALSVFKEGDEL